MMCKHKVIDKIVSRDVYTVYEICAHCQKLLVSYPYTEGMTGVDYIMMHSERWKLFEHRVDGEYHVQRGRLIFSPRLEKACVTSRKNSYIQFPQATTPPLKKEPLFFTNIKEEDLIELVK